MNTFAITYPNTDTPGNSNGRAHEIARVIADLFDVICCEYDDGLSFVRSDLDAHSILTQIAEFVDLELIETVYVMQLGGEFAAHGTTKVIRALEGGM